MILKRIRLAWTDGLEDVHVVTKGDAFKGSILEYQTDDIVEISASRYNPIPRQEG